MTKIGQGDQAETRYLKMKPFCDFAYEWIKMNR